MFSDDEDATLTGAAVLAEAARTVDARWALAAFRTGLDARTTPLLRRCAEIVAEAGARIAVEFSPLGVVSNIADARAVVAAIGPEHSGVLIATPGTSSEAPAPGSRPLGDGSVRAGHEDTGCPASRRPSSAGAAERSSGDDIRAGRENSLKTRLDAADRVVVGEDVGSLPFDRVDDVVGDG